MSIFNKHDFPPLLGPGRHEMTLMEFKGRFVDPYPQSITRKQIYLEFEQFWQDYLVAGFPCIMWIDGSFVTEKPDPNDIDVAVFIDEDVNETLNDDQKKLIDRTNDEQNMGKINGFAYVSLGREHPLYQDESINPIIGWHETFGLGHDKKWLKGFVVLRVRDNHV